MKQRTTAAIILVAAMVITLMGCSYASAMTVPGDDLFEYNGKFFSILDDLQTTKKKVDEVCKPVPDYPVMENGEGSNIYQYDPVGNGQAQFMLVTFTNNGTEAVGQISIQKSDFKTSRGIGIGSPAKKVFDAYGKPKKVSGNGNFFHYNFDNYVILFYSMDGKVFSIDYFNLDYYNSRK